MALKPARIYVTHFGMHENLKPLHELLRRTIEDYAEIEQELAVMDQRERRIGDAILQAGINYLLDQQCGVDTDTIKSLIDRDMELNAQGLNHWLTAL